MVYQMTLYEIKEKYKERYGEDWAWAFDNSLTVNDNFLARYDNDDEFYTDMINHYLPVDDVESYIDERQAWIWCNECSDVDYIVDGFYEDFKKAITYAEKYTLIVEEILKAYKEHAIDNADNYLEWLWGQE